MADRASQVFAPDEMIPAVGQGAIVVEARAGDQPVVELLASITDEHTRLACETERAFMARLGGGCQLPFGAHAIIDNDELTLRAFVADDSGTKQLKGELAVPLVDAPGAGTRLAERLLNEGAAELMEAAL